MQMTRQSIYEQLKKYKTPDEYFKLLVPKHGKTD